jgi:hypothetical protein
MEAPWFHFKTGSYNDRPQRFHDARKTSKSSVTLDDQRIIHLAIQVLFPLLVGAHVITRKGQLEMEHWYGSAWICPADG